MSQVSIRNLNKKLQRREGQIAALTRGQEKKAIVNSSKKDRIELRKTPYKFAQFAEKISICDR